MKKLTLALIVGLLSVLSVSAFPRAVLASNSVKVLPSNAYVGMFRTILIDVEASDDAYGVFDTSVRASNVPAGVLVSFSPSDVLMGSIKSTMLVHAGAGATTGSYTIAITVRWTTIIGTYWETSKTFALEVRGVSEGYWALNPSLLLQSPPNPTTADRWYARCTEWNWATGGVGIISNSQYHYVNWNVSGRVDMMARDTVFDTVDEVADFTQGDKVYFPPQITMDPTRTQFTIKAAATSIATNSPTNPLSWTGIKFDATAVSTKDGRQLYIELYFVRTGGNLLWSILPGAISNDEVCKVVGNCDNYMVAIDASEDYNTYFTKIVTIGPTTWFTIDLSWYFQWAAYRYQQGYPDTWAGRSINDYVIQRVGPCLEANYGGAFDIYPQCSISFEDIEVKGSYIPDVTLDGKVDMHDIALIASRFGATIGDPTPGAPSYLPNADINLDGKIDMRDISLASAYFGKTFP